MRTLRWPCVPVWRCLWGSCVALGCGLFLREGLRRMLSVLRGCKISLLRRDKRSSSPFSARPSPSFLPLTRLLPSQTPAFAAALNRLGRGSQWLCAPRLRSGTTTRERLLRLCRRRGAQLVEGGGGTPTFSFRSVFSSSCLPCCGGAWGAAALAVASPAAPARNGPRTSEQETIGF